MKKTAKHFYILTVKPQLTNGLWSAFFIRLRFYRWNMMTVEQLIENNG